MIFVRHCIGIIGTIVLAIGSLAVTGHLLKVTQMYVWIQDVGMAFNMAIAFVAVGTGFIIISLSNRLWKQ